MERIQSALAKARTARDRKLNPGQSGSAAVVPEGHWLSMTAVSPDPLRLARNRIVAGNPGRSAANFDIMRTNLLRTLRASNWTRVAITSATPGCGKSTVALNLALSVARLTEKKVLLVELDLRRPSLVGMLGLKEKPDFAARLAQGKLDYSQICRIGNNFALALNSHPVESPAELLAAPRTADLIDEMEARLEPDVVIFDMSPMLVGDDALAFLDQVDCALMVAAAEETTASEIEKCGADLAKRTQVLGVILNKCRYMEEDTTHAYPV